MKILVCIKQVPGTSDVKVDPVTGVLIRSGVESKMNPYDLYALETALTLAQQTGSSVKVISMGPPAASAVIKEAAYMGCEGGVLLSDRKFAGADVLATSYALSQGIRSMGEFDLILCGKQTTDGDTAQVGSEIAELLGLSHLANVQSIQELTNEYITVKANQDNLVITEKLPLACLLCMDAAINTPRLPSYKRSKALADSELCVVRTLADMTDKQPDRYGLAGSPTQVEKIFPPEKNVDKKIFEGDSEFLSNKLSELITAKKFI